jgi:hypothetical protein
MEHEQVSLSASEVRELQRIESELAMIDSADDGFSTVHLVQHQLRRRMLWAGLLALGAGALIIATFTFSVLVAFTACVATLVGAVAFADALVLERRCRLADRRDSSSTAWWDLF